MSNEPQPANVAQDRTGPVRNVDTPSLPEKKARLHWIECLRGIAVVAVLCQHMLLPQIATYFHGFRNFLDFGVFGVIVFFCISGYIIPYSVIGLKGMPGLRFPVARFFRLYPAYWLSLLLAIWAFHPSISLLLVNATMAQRFLRRPDVIGVYWTLQVELIFYVIVEILILKDKFSSTFLYPVFAVVFALLSIVMGAGRHFLDKKMPVAPSAGLAVMFLATTYFMHTCYGLSSRLRMVLFSIAIYALLCVSFLLGYSKDWGYQETPGRFCVMYLFAILVFLGVQALSLRSSVFGFLGRISYPIYLFHIPVITLMAIALPSRFGLHWDILIDLATIFLVSTAVHYVVEKNFVRWGRSLLEQLA